MVSGKIGSTLMFGVVLLLAALASFTASSVALAVGNSTTLPNGANLTVSIDSPGPGTEFLADGAPVPVTVTGTASIGVGNPQATIVYVFDASGSTLNGSFGCGNVLACEKAFFTALNNAAVASGSVKQIALVAFGANARTADMTPAVGDVPLGAPADGNTVISSITVIPPGFVYQIGQYTLRNDGDGDGTNYAAAITNAVAILNSAGAGPKFVIMASDGLSNLGGGAFAGANAALAATGARVDTIAIATNCTGGSDGDLEDIDANGGSCTVVTDPAKLPDLIPNLIGSTLTKVEMTVDGGAPVPLTTVPGTPQPGPANVTYNTSTAGLNPGVHDICAKSFGTDVTGGSANTEICIKVEVFDLTLAPPTAVNELGSDNTHTVTATLLGPAGQVAGYLVTFAVGGQNAGALGVCNPVACTTNPAGVVTFTYTVPIAPASLGTDTINASVTLNSPTGAKDTEEVKKTWRDTTPPKADCVPTTNPAGKNEPNAPGKGGQGQNQDGFYELLAKDDVWPVGALKVFVADTGSAAIFGPHPVGTKIKLTQAPGATPNEKPGAGVINFHITLKGDALVTAVDGSGNTSPAVSCKVPPPPK